MRSPHVKDPNTISLEAAAEEPVAFDFELTVPAKALDREPLLEVSDVLFAGEVSPIEAGYALSGDLSWSGKLECSRCLAAYPFATDENFSLVLYKRAAGDPAERQLDKDDLDVYFFDEPELSVLPIVEERIQMAVPMKPLCKEDCLGLCPTCGEDLNQGNCECREETIDPRWEALSKLKKV
ncbi:MAG TPA: DUF177 domain-containing protein [Thermoanaerobaculia bacterium]|jgi:uncharacterized protein|nr:DUF177 domain-containing protein [Thermoanaerobaculia bacterium]